MPHRIDLPDNIYQRLAKLAEGFDTPANVIERLLDHYTQAPESVSTQQPPTGSNLPSQVEIEILPNPISFKEELLEQKRAWVLLRYTDGSTKLREWRTHRFSEKSDVVINLRSGYLRGWREKGIVKAEVSINREALEEQPHQ